MFGTYLRRELRGRRRQTLIIAIGMGLAIALVILVNSVSAGVRDAQASVLQSVYGVGTDITVTQTPAAPTDGAARGQRFDFGSTDGTTADGTTNVSQSRLEAGRGTTAFASSAVDTAADTDNVAAAAGVLNLTNTTFNGQLPNRSQTNQGTDATADGTGTDAAAPAEPPAGGPDSAGGSSFDLNSFSVLGYDPADAAIGPLSAATLADGRTLASSDSGTDVALLDSAYATEQSLAVGGTIDIAGTTFDIVGLVTSTSSDGTSAANVYIPLDVAQTLSGLTDQVTSVYVQAASADDIAQIQTDLEKALPDATVSTQADLASTVSGSLSSASGLITGLGTWLSIIVLAAAVLLAVLFTVSGVARRTREFGTLKAIGWSNGRIVGQVAGESFVQGAIGAALGVVLGLLGIVIVNLFAPTLSTANTASAAGAPAAAGSTAGTGAAGAAGGFPGGQGGFGGMRSAVSSVAADVTLHLPVTLGVVGIAVGLAILGAIIAGAFGGWRAARLRPAAAFRSVN